MTQIIVRLMSQRGAPDELLLKSHLPGGSLDQGDFRFTVSEERADVVVVLNYLKYDTEITSRSGYIWCWHNEPIVRKPFPRGFDRILTHEDSSDPRVVKKPPVLDWWVHKSWDELSKLKAPQKSDSVSVIASNKEMISGHQRRNAFIDVLSREFPNLPIFGEGRAESLDDKWDGLNKYRYSVAIENTSKPDYWTEKIADCFLSYTVPIYFGATNIGDYFPSDSFIWLPINDDKEALETIRRCMSDNHWEARLPALHEARRKLLNQYSLFGQVQALIRAEAETIRHSAFEKTRVHGRRTRQGGWVRGAGLYGNLKNQVLRFRGRFGKKS